MMQKEQDSEGAIDKSIKVCFNEEKQILNFRQTSNRLINNKCWIIGVLQSRDWTQIRTIDLLLANIQDHSLQSFSKISLPSLQRLGLNKNYRLRSTFVRQLISQDPLNYLNLKYLQLWYAKLGNQGAKYLTKIRMPNLQNLAMGYCCIGNEGFRNLRKGNWPHLRKLILSYNDIKGSGMHQIYDTQWGQLSQLSLHFNEIKNIFAFQLMMLQSNVQIWDAIQNMHMEPFHTDIQAVLGTKLIDCSNEE